MELFYYISLLFLLIYVLEKAQILCRFASNLKPPGNDIIFINYSMCKYIIVSYRIHVLLLDYVTTATDGFI